MNERIFKLMCKANISDIRSFHPIPITTDDVQKLFEKFAELVVEECAEIAKFNVMNISTYADAEVVEEQIKQHFGVE